MSAFVVDCVKFYLVSNLITGYYAKFGCNFSNCVQIYEVLQATIRGMPGTHPDGDEVNALETCTPHMWPRAGSGVVRMDPLRFLAGCRTRRLNQA